MAKRWRDAKHKRDVGTFAALPHMVLRSEEFAALPAIGVKLLMDLISQYDGFNNGDLTLTWSVMVKRGWKSRDTLGRARQELMDRGWIALTAQGGLHKPSLYGLTMYALDASKKLEVSERAFPRGAWNHPDRAAQVKIKPSITPTVSIKTGTDTPSAPIHAEPQRIDTPAVSVTTS